MQMSEKKRRIKEAAIRVMAKKGFHYTRPSDIAQEADVAVGTIYNYFDSKDEILETIFADELKKRMNFLIEAEKKKDSFWERLEYFLCKHFEEIKENPDLGKILVREKDIKKSEGKPIKDYYQLIPDRIAKLIINANDRNEIDIQDFDVYSSMLFGAIQGVVEKAINENNPDMLNKAPQIILKLFRNGMK
jgi:TetR/AcrR family fatty acid metabolism transcriptional regulator